MNPTKNVRYIEVENDIFEQLCEYEYDKKVQLVQAKELPQNKITIYIDKL